MSDEELLRQRIQELEKELAEMQAEQKQIGFELRTRLVPMKGCIQTLIDDENEDWYTREDRREFYTIINDNVDHLGRLINALYVPRPKRDGSLVMEWQKEVDIREILESVITRKQISTGRHQFVLDFEPERIVIETDYRQFATIFDIFLDNAIKYSPEGGLIEVIARTETANEKFSFGTLFVQIKQPGIGLTKEQVEHLRQPKFVGVIPITSPLSGIRLAQALIKEHQGTMEWDSEGVDRGITLSVRIPVRQATQDDEGEETC